MYLSKGQGKVLRSKISGMEPTNSMHGAKLTDEQNTTKYIEGYACINRQQATLHENYNDLRPAATGNQDGSKVQRAVK